MPGQGRQFATRVEDILKRMGTRFGEGEVTGTITRVVGRTGPAHAPTGERTETHSFTGLWAEFTDQERIADVIEDSDRLLEVGADKLNTAPRSQDRITIGSESLVVKRVRTIQPGSVPLLYRVTVTT